MSVVERRQALTGRSRATAASPRHMGRENTIAMKRNDARKYPCALHTALYSCPKKHKQHDRGHRDQPSYDRQQSIVEMPSR